jgi:hypothetical protein
MCGEYQGNNWEYFWKYLREEGRPVWSGLMVDGITE